MAQTSYVPEKWATELLLRREPANRYRQVTNSDYQGEITNMGGDVVHINTPQYIGVPGNYSLTTGFSGKRRLSTAKQTLDVDQFKDIVMELDFVEDAQNKQTLTGAALSAQAFEMEANLNRYLAQVIYDGGNLLTGQSDAADALTDSGDGALGKALIDARAQMVNASVPIESGLFIIVDAGGYAILLKDPSFRDASQSGDSNALRAGRVGIYFGAIVIETPVMPTLDASATQDVEHVAMVVHTSACTLAERMWGPRVVPSTDFMGDEAQLVHQYGAKVTRPDHIVLVHWKLGS